jgi:microcystin degradation protein MlrC
MSFRVLSAEIHHETNTFSVHPTGLAAFESRYLLHGAAALAARGDHNTELAGLLDVAHHEGWQVQHVVSAAAGPGGKVTAQAFEALVTPVIDAARKAKKNGALDGVMLMLHGAMVTTSSNDGEGEILRLLRDVTGPDIPVAVSLDPHANVSTQMCALANILVSYTTYPHIDIRTTGARAAKLLHLSMARQTPLRTVRAHRPMLEEANGGRTDTGPMIARHALARAHEGHDGLHAISVNGGFPCADIEQVGPTVLVTCDALGPHASAKAAQIAERLADDIWNCRKDGLNTYLSVQDAARRAFEWCTPDFFTGDITCDFTRDGGTRPAPQGALVIADYADNPGAGAYGDGTALLAALLEHNVAGACFGPMVDPAAVQTLYRSGPGTVVTLELGGKTEPRLGGGPLWLTGEFVARYDGLVTGSGPMMAGLTRDFGPTAVFRVAGIDILVVSIPHQMLDLEQFVAFGILPQNMKVIALKSMQHFRAAFAPVAGEVIVCDSGALCTLDYASLPYCHVPRPVWPLDEM